MQLLYSLRFTYVHTYTHENTKPARWIVARNDNWKRELACEYHERTTVELKASKQTERQRNRHHQSNYESTKRNEAAAFFGGADTANVFETAIGELSADDNDDDNYYDDDGFENDDANGNDIDEDDDDGDDVDDGDGDVDDDQPRDAPTEPTEMTDHSEATERSESNEASDSVRYFRGGYAGKQKNKNSNRNNNNNNNNNNGNNIKMNGSKIVVFDNFKLDESGDGESAGDGYTDANGDRARDRDDVASESGSDFASFEGNSSSFDVVIAMKPDKNKVNEQQQLQQQQQQLQQQHSQKEQQQHKTEQQQLEKHEQQQQMHYKPLKLSKQQQQKHLQQLQMKQQSTERQQQKALRERTENYDTHIQQQQQLLLQQVYEEQKIHSQQLAKRDERRCAPKTLNNKVSAEQIFKQSNNLQKQLKQQLEEHQRCIIEQQQQQHLHQQQLQQQKMFERKNELKLQEKPNQQQQQQQSLPPPKPLTRKHLQAQAQHQARSTVPSRHTSRASTSRLPSSRVSPLRTTSRGLLSTRAKSLSSCRNDMHAEKSKLLKKRRNPLNSPPPAPSATPTNSARTPRSARVSAVSSAGAGCNTTKVRPPAQQALRPSHTTPNMAFYEADDVGAGGDTHATGAKPLQTQSQMLQMCSMLKSEFVDMMIPFASNGVGNATKITSAKAPEPRSDQCSDKAQSNQAENLANHDLIEALTNCLFKYNEAMKDNGKNTDSPGVATPKAAGKESRNLNPAW